jgi:hypothetical protein
VQLQAEAAQRLKECDEAVAALSKLTSQAQQLLARQPAWPRHETLLRFELPLFVWKQHLLFMKEWASRFVVLRGSRLYYSNGKSGHPDSLEGSLAFMRSNPAPDGHYCLDLKGACARCATSAFCCASQSLLDAGCSVAPCSAAVDGQAFAFEIKFPAGPKVRALVFSMCARITLRAAGCEGRAPGCRRRRDAPALRAHHRSRERLLLPA